MFDYVELAYEVKICHGYRNTYIYTHTHTHVCVSSVYMIG